MIVQYAPGGLPFVEITLTYKAQKITRPALVDSGSTINVLPYEDGCELGLSWEAQQVRIKNEGFLTGAPIYAVLLTAYIAPFKPVELAFAWTQKSRNVADSNGFC